jgi:hypothetical protein
MSESQQQLSGNKRCFVIAPIGADRSPERHRSDQVLRHVIEPAAKECGYEEVLRSDKVDDPGVISTQIINHLLDDELVIADLTGHNPNVFYELAIRHAVQKPIVQIMEEGERPPFDVSHVRTLFLNHQDLDSAFNCRNALARSIRAVEKDPSLVDSPISQAITIKALSESPKPQDQLDAQILDILASLSRRVNIIAARLPDGRSHDPLFKHSPVNADSRLTFLRGLISSGFDHAEMIVSPSEVDDLARNIDTKIPNSVTAETFRLAARTIIREYLPESAFPDDGRFS